MFQQFVWDLLISIKGADGNFTFAKQTPSGSLVKAIDTLEGHLPAGFVPSPLPGSTIQRLIDLHKRQVAALDKLDRDPPGDAV
jgi:hypothetical protein